MNYIYTALVSGLIGIFIGALIWRKNGTALSADVSTAKSDVSSVTTAIDDVKKAL